MVYLEFVCRLEDDDLLDDAGREGGDEEVSDE